MRVAVIGGGVAGLSAAHALLAGGAEPVVFEASSRAGGQVGTFSERGWLTEDGPHFVSRPVDSLPGLPGEVVEPQLPATRWVHLGGRVFKAPSLGLLARAGVLRALLEPLVAPPLAQALSSFESQPVTVVHLGFPHQQTPRGFGMIDADGTLHAVGTLFPSSMLPGRAPAGKSLVTAICRGEGDAGRVLADLRATFGVP